jgi:hypothetical protein
LGLPGAASSEHRLVGLLTWCPNFESLYLEVVDFCEHKGFEAGFEPGGLRLSYFEVLEASNEMRVKGFHVDIVKRVVSSSSILYYNLDQTSAEMYRSADLRVARAGTFLSCLRGPLLQAYKRLVVILYLYSLFI